MEINNRSGQDNEYLELKKQQKKTRVTGAVMFVVGLVFYPIFIVIGMPLLVAPAAICFVMGLILFIRSFKHQKYAVLNANAVQTGTEKVKTANTKKSDPCDNLMLSQYVAYYVYQDS